jgi:hypothetical protein
MNQPNATDGPLLAHMVYFSLYDATEEARGRLLHACQKYLAGHPGILFFGCGTRDAELRREVNVLDFDVGLHIVFRDRAAHDHYQQTAEHLQFIAENKHNWRQVRVFDSLLVPGSM